MTIRYVGPGGNDGNSGLTWALRKLTLNGVEDTPVVVEDTVYVGPGVYREMLTVDVDGGNAYTAGTVAVTNGSTTVVGAGTAFVANIAVGRLFWIRYFANGNDGVANGTATFTSAAGNFQASMIGKSIQINTRAPYNIGAVAAANSITLVDVHGLGWPAAAVGLSYSVMSGEGPYEVDSVTDNTHFELTGPWCAATVTGLAYIVYAPIRYIGDVTGEHTDGVGGIVRITGSDNDTTQARAYCILMDGRQLRLFRGFQLDMASVSAIVATSFGLWFTFEDLYIMSNSSPARGAVDMQNCVVGVTLRRVIFYGNLFNDIKLEGFGAHDDTNHVIENCESLMYSNFGSFVTILENGGVTVKNCALHALRGVEIFRALTTGQTCVVNNCIAETCAFAGVEGINVGDVTEDYNSFFNNATDRRNVVVGANSVTFPALFAGPLLSPGFKFPWHVKSLSEWSQVSRIAGFQAACHDLYGFSRPVTNAKKSWGPIQYTDAERDTGTVYEGLVSYEILDAGRIQFKVPCTDRSYMVRVRVQREANYAGVNPQIVIKQPGQADRTTVDAGAAGAWNLLEDTFIPAVDPEYFFVELVSNNTAVAGNYATFFDALEIRGEPQNPGNFEHWMWDRQPFETLPSNALVVSGREYRRRRLPGEVSAMDAQ